MSNRDLKYVQSQTNTPLTDLRSGKERTRSEMEKERLSSTRNGEGPSIQEDLSTIDTVEDDTHVMDSSVYRNSEIIDHYIESPQGEGEGTRPLRTSEDDYLLGDTVQQDYAELEDRVEKYSTELKNHQNFKSMIDTEYILIDDDLKSLISKLGLVGQSEYLRKANKLRGDLMNAKAELTKLILDEEHNPIFSDPKIHPSRLENSQDTDVSEASTTINNGQPTIEDMREEQSHDNEVFEENAAEADDQGISLLSIFAQIMALHCM